MARPSRKTTDQKLRIVPSAVERSAAKTARCNGVSEQAAAGLEVCEGEAGVFFHDVSDMLTDDVLAWLLAFDNVVVTSHQAFLTEEALANIADTTLANIDEYLRGKRGPELTNSAT